MKGALSTFGGAKGSGIGFMIEILAGAFVGAESNVQGRMKENWGGLVAAFRADLFGTGDALDASIQGLESDIHGLHPTTPGGHVGIPGERGLAIAYRRQQSVPVDSQVYEQLYKMAE